LAESFVVVSFLAIYFSSGFAALLYQVIWQRILAMFSGADLYATTTIVASFMGGLGAGSLFAGMLADKVSARWQIGLFALAEFLTGIFGVLSKWLYYDVLYSRFGHLAGSPFLLTTVLFTSLLVPTFLMGMTLPLLSKALTPTVELAGKRIGSLYALNTLGAASGALVTGWLLMGRLAFPQILQIGATINLAAALLTLLLGVLLWRRLDSVPVEGDLSGDLQVQAPLAFSMPVWILIYALSGFLALSLEIVWFRLLGVMLKSTSLTFPHLLGIYLGSLALGLIAGLQLLKSGRRPAKTFLGLQSGITIYTALSIAVLVSRLDHWPVLQWLRTYLATYNPFDVGPARSAIEKWIFGAGSSGILPAIAGPQPNFLSLYVLLPLILIGPPTFMMGASFASLQRTVQDNRRWLGSRVGWLQASNIFGATLGAISVGGFFLEFLGTTGTLRLLITLGGCFLLLLTTILFQSRSKGRKIGYVVALATIGVVIWSVPSRSALWAKLHGSPSEQIISSEDGSGLSVLKNDGVNFSSTTWVYSNGLGQSWVPYTDVDSVHSLLGILPVMLHHQPTEIAVIGLGSGDTLYSLGGREETKEITCIEIVEPQLDSLKLLHRRSPYGGLESLFSDVRIRYVFTDGRRYIGSKQKKYDIIEADALRPTSAFAGNLYSYEYFLLLKSRLKPGGLAVTWGPTQRVIQAFLKVFPHVLQLSSILIGSAEPIAFDREVIKARSEHAFTEIYYAKAGMDVQQLLSPFLDGNLEDIRLDHADFDLTDFNTDLFPKDEYGR
jgi:spermidine synthase